MYLQKCCFYNVKTKTIHKHATKNWTVRLLLLCSYTAVADRNFKIGISVKSERWKILPRRIMAGKVWRCSQAFPTDHEWMLYELELPCSFSSRGPLVFSSSASPLSPYCSSSLLSAAGEKRPGDQTSHNQAYRFLSGFCGVNPGARKLRVIEMI